MSQLVSKQRRSTVGWRARAGLAMSVVCIVCWAESCRAQSAVPAGAIAFFDSGSCPEGWEVFADAQGRAVVAVTSSSYDVGATKGVPLAGGEQPKHDHKFSLNFKLKRKELATSHPGGNDKGASYRKSEDDKPPQADYKADGTTESSSSGLAFVQLAVCQLQPSQGVDP